MPKELSITYAGGFWSTNVGNAFYDLGILYALKKIKPSANVSFLQDPIAYGVLPHQVLTTRLGISASLDPTQALNFDYFDYLSTDILIMSGPLLSIDFVRYIYPNLLKLSDRGIKIVLLSAGSVKYTKVEFSTVRECLKKLKPFALFSRDRETFDAYGDLFEAAYDGICFAFFANDYHSASKLNLSNMIAINFDKGLDRDLSSFEKIQQSDAIEISRNGSLKRSVLAGLKKEFLGRKIIRPDHQFFRKSYIQALKFGWIRSDTPETYLSIYKNVPLTISERVHACVPSLAFGNSALLITDTPRSKIFDRVSMSSIRYKFSRIKNDYLEDEKTRMLQALAEVFRY